MTGLDRQSAVRFSFILSIPAIIGASIFEVPDLFAQHTDPAQWRYTSPGMAVAAIVGVFAMKLLKYIAQKSNFRIFSYYCWAVALWPWSTVSSNLPLQNKESRLQNPF